MGRERYAWIFRQDRPYGAELFEKARFCLDHRNDDSHHRVAQAYYAELLDRFDECLIVGDKFPNFFNDYNKLFDAFPSGKVIFMLRNVFHVAQSFQQRADWTRQANLEAG